MTPNNVATRRDQTLRRMEAAYDAHLRNLHSNAATHASSLLEESGLLDLIPGDSEYVLLLCFEVLRQLAHETCNGFEGTAELLELINEEVEELCRGSHGPKFRKAIELKAFRESKNPQLGFFDFSRFTLFAMKADMELFPDGMLGVDAAVN